MNVLMIPGLGNSGADHWQSLWEVEDPSMFRIRVKDWERPICSEWSMAIDAAFESSRGAMVVVGHSLGCLAFVHWIARTERRIHGALLVAVPDPDGGNFPKQAQGFSPLPMKRLPFPSIVVSSQDDPYGGSPYARICAGKWGSTLVDIGRAGHINGASRIGRWPHGLELLNTLRLAN